jgi:hypothetical protein
MRSVIISENGRFVNAEATETNFSNETWIIIRGLSEDPAPVVFLWAKSNGNYTNPQGIGMKRGAITEKRT